MRKSKNYYKFMEYMAFGISGWHDDAVMVDNGVIECVAYPKVAHIEDYSKLYKCNYDKMTMDSDNTWLTIKCVLVNEEVINVYYVTNECNLYIGQLILDDYRTQKQALDAIHKKVVCFFLNSREFCELHPTEEINEYEETSEAEETEEIEDLDEYEDIIENEDLDEIIANENLDETEEITSETIPHVDVDCSNLKKVSKHSIYGMFGNMSLPCRVCTHFCTRLDTDNYTFEYCCRKNKENEKKAIKNPEWHHVSLSTLANLDFDMLDEKRQLYLKLYRELNELIQDLHKCKSGRAYERRLAKMYIRNAELIDENKISHDYINYVTRKISMCNVECGLWTSLVEEATGLHKSRRYNMHTLRY